MSILRHLAWYLTIFIPFGGAYGETSTSNCMDGFCIGQSINSSRFDEAQWLIPKSGVQSTLCKTQGCQPEVEFPGYPPSVSKALSELAIISTPGVPSQATIITSKSLNILRELRYDCTRPARRVVGIYRSHPSGYLTYVWLRIFPDGLRVFRVARDFPYRNTEEFKYLIREIDSAYGNKILYYDGHASNAKSDVIEQRKEGWFGFTDRNTADPTDNIAQLVLIDPLTRNLLTHSSGLTAGEIELIQPLWYQPEQCARRLPIQ